MSKILEIRVGLSEETIQAEFFRALARHQLPEKFFYWFPLSVSSWIRLCESKAYKNSARSLYLCRRHAGEILSRIGSRPLQWISLGCGHGIKEIPFLRASLRRGQKVTYLPVDASLPLLKKACGRGLALKIKTVGIKADVNAPFPFRRLLPDRVGKVRVISLFGNTLEPIVTGGINAWDRLMKPGDFFLVDGELFFGEETLAGYDHPVNRHFAMAPLHSIGVTERDGTLLFRFEKGRNGIHRLAKSFHFRRTTHLSVSGHAFSFKKGSSIQMSPSYKCDRERMRKLLEAGGTLSIVEEYKTPDRRYLLWLCRKN